MANSFLIIVSYAHWEYSGANCRRCTLPESVPTKSIAGTWLLSVYCQRLYISSDGRDIVSFGGLGIFDFFGTGLMNVFCKTLSSSIECLLLMGALLLTYAGWSLSGYSMLWKAVLASLSLRCDLVWSIVDNIRLPEYIRPFGSCPFSSCGVLIFTIFLIEGEKFIVTRFES